MCGKYLDNMCFYIWNNLLFHVQKKFEDNVTLMLVTVS